MRARAREMLKVTCPAPTLSVRADEAQHAYARTMMRVFARAVHPVHPWPGSRREIPMRAAAVDLHHRRGHVGSHAQRLKVTPTTRYFDTDADSGTAAMGLPKATHGPGWWKGA